MTGTTGAAGTNRKAVWLRIVPLVFIAVCAGALCAQSACSSGTDDTFYYMSR